MRATLIHNPTAGDERPTADDLKQILRDAGFQVHYQSYSKGWKKAIQDAGDDLIAVAGGDGTVAAALKYIAGVRPGGAPIGLLPVGTANNICRTLGVIGDAREIVASWRLGKTRPFDLGIITSADADGDFEERFAEGCGGGAFAALMEVGKDAVEKASEFMGNESDRALGALDRLIQDAEPRQWGIEIDGRDRSGDFVAVEVLNIPFAGPSVPLAPAADPGDGLLDVVLIGDGERPGLHRYLADRLERKAGEEPRLPAYRGREVTLRRTARVPARVDGELIKDKDLDRLLVRIEPGAVTVLVPPEKD